MTKFLKVKEKIFNLLSNAIFCVFSRGLRDSISHCVGPSVCRSVPPLLFWRFRCFASGFSIAAPAQLHVTDAVVSTALPTAPALQISAPAEPPRLGLSCIRPCLKSDFFGCHSVIHRLALVGLNFSRRFPADRRKTDVRWFRVAQNSLPVISLKRMATSLSLWFCLTNCFSRRRASPPATSSE